MPDDIRTKAEEYVDYYIASVEEQLRPSAQQRMEAIEKVERYTRALLKADKGSRL